MNYRGKSVNVAENVRLYKQVRSPYWWVNIRIDGQQKRQSTKVRIEDDVTGEKGARDAAIEISTESKFKVEHGIDLSNKPTFHQVADNVINAINSKAVIKEQDKSHISVINNYLKPYFKRISIDRVDRHQIYKFYCWREEKSKAEVSLTQKRVTNKALMMIFDLACDLGYIKQYDIPQLPKIKVKPSVGKDSFNKDELTRIHGDFEGFIKDARNKKSLEVRQLLECYVHFLSGTGARPGKEVLSLTYGDVGWERINNKVVWYATIRKGKVAGRMGNRKIILSDRAIDALNKIVELRPYFEGKSLSNVVKNYKSKVIFVADYRGTPPDFIKPFDQYMTYLGMADKNHTLYSLRHTYITINLLSGVIPRRAIAKQCGTSEDMIERYYDHVLTLDYADELKQSDNLPSLGAANLLGFFE